MRMPFLVAAVDRALRRAGAPARGETLVVGLSGGADSVALTDALASLQRRHGFRLVAAHLDHGLRPELGRRRGLLPRLLRDARRPLPGRQRAGARPRRAARRAGSSRPRASSATRSCAG